MVIFRWMFIFFFFWNQFQTSKLLLFQTPIKNTNIYITLMEKSLNITCTWGASVYVQSKIYSFQNFKNPTQCMHKYSWGKISEQHKQNQWKMMVFHQILSQNLSLVYLNLTNSTNFPPSLTKENAKQI